MTDSIFVQRHDDSGGFEEFGIFEEFHPVFYGNGCWTASPLKGVWKAPASAMKRLSILLFFLAAAGVLLMPLVSGLYKPKLAVVHFDGPPNQKIYNLIILPSEQKVSAPGTRITNNGFCTTVWIGEVADTVICGSHIVTETTSGPAQEKDFPAPPDNRQTQKRHAPETSIRFNMISKRNSARSLIAPTFVHRRKREKYNPMPEL